MIERISALRQIIVMLNIIKTGLAFSQEPTDKILDSLCRSPSLKKLDFLKLCKKYYETDGDFRSAWEKSVKNSTKVLDENARYLLLSMGEYLGSTDAMGQIEQTQMYLSMFSDLLKDEENRLKKDERIHLWSGICSGLAALVILW